MSGNQALNFSIKSPDGYSRYVTLLIAGIQYSKDDALAFCRGFNHSLSFDRDLHNKYDKHAIKIIGHASGVDYFIGFVDKATANKIVRSKVENFVLPELDRIFFNDNFVDIRYHVVGPKELKKQFNDWENLKPLNLEQKDFFDFFQLPIPKGLKYAEANKFINSFEKELKNSDWKSYEEYSSFTFIHEEFQDSYFRSDCEIKKPKRKEINEALDYLKNTGKSYKYMSEHMEQVVDILKAIYPALVKKLSIKYY